MWAVFGFLVFRMLVCPFLNIFTAHTETYQTQDALGSCGMKRQTLSVATSQVEVLLKPTGHGSPSSTLYMATLAIRIALSADSLLGMPLTTAFLYKLNRDTYQDDAMGSQIFPMLEMELETYVLYEN